jgi:hypothetical protein
MMKRATPNTSNDQAIVEWFARAGLAVEVVEHCADAACEHCETALDQAA